MSYTFQPDAVHHLLRKDRPETLCGEIDTETVFWDERIHTHEMGIVKVCSDCLYNIHMNEDLVKWRTTDAFTPR